MNKLVTGDGSVTFHNPDYNETYHSRSGAIEESFEKFAKPCNLKPGMKILDICFGIGYNTLAALHTTKPLTIIALENDPNILKKTQELDIDFKEYDIIKKVAKTLSYKDENYEINILLGDARETLKQLNTKNIKFNVVFLDPFSPPKCPELWTEAFFKDIYSLMEKGAILTTYSCARVVRDNLQAAGFQVKDGIVVGRKAPSTIAIKQ